MEHPKPVIELRHLCLAYDDLKVVDDLNLEIYENEFVTFLGPSGCGKTTTLRMIAGLESPDSGEIVIDGKIVNDLPAYARPTKTVFQKYALFPNMNVIQNVMVGLKNKKQSQLIEFYGGREKIEEELKADNKKVNYFTIKKLLDKKIYADALKYLAMVNLTGFEKREIDQMSGGQQQRCAIARALINKPRILLLDEPLSALDLKLRENMQYELKEMQRKLGITFIFVTHDQTEAMTMSSRIVVLNGGKIQQVGTPKEIYDFPQNKFVAQFVGESNIFPGKYVFEDNKYKIKFYDSELEFFEYKDFKDGEDCQVVIRPEDVDIVPLEEASITATVRTCIFKGESYEICAYRNGKEIVIHKYLECKPNSEIGITTKPYNIHIMKVER